MKAMVSDGQCTAVFGCRRAGPDDCKLAKKTCKSKRLSDSYSTNFSKAFEALDESDEAPQALAVTALSSWANKVSVRWSINRDRAKKPICADKTCVNEAELNE